jgi:hypothetical protein
MENIVAKYKGYFIITDEFLTYDECLRESVWRWLNRIREGYSPLRTIAEESLETRLVIGGSDDQHISYPGLQKSCQWVVDHGLIVNRDLLLADGFCDGVKASSGTAGKYDTFHAFSFSFAM